MQHPLQSLHVLLCSLQPEKLSASPRQLHASATLRQVIIDSFAKARIDCCIYLSAAGNTEHIYCMVHAMLIMTYEMQLMIKSYTASFPAYAGLKQQDIIKEYYALTEEQLEELLSFLQENFLTPRMRPSKTAIAEQCETNAAVKQFVTNLSVPQLALFMRLLLEANILEEDTNVRGFAMHIASCMRTKKAPYISPESLRIKYYTPEKAAINIMKEYLVRMMNLLKGY